MREIVAGGHAVGNHTHSHPTLPLLTAERLRDGSHLEPPADRGRSIAATRAALEHHAARGAPFVTCRSSAPDRGAPMRLGDDSSTAVALASGPW